MIQLQHFIIDFTSNTCLAGQAEMGINYIWIVMPRTDAQWAIENILMAPKTSLLKINGIHVNKIIHGSTHQGQMLPRRFPGKLKKFQLQTETPMIFKPGFHMIATIAVATVAAIVAIIWKPGFIEMFQLQITQVTSFGNSDSKTVYF